MVFERFTLVWTGADGVYCEHRLIGDKADEWRREYVANPPQCGVEVCFANPGTSEMHMVSAIGKDQSMRSVLGLFEGVCSGAADGYARIAGKPALTLLHLGPGLSNASANLHNAKKAFSPVINLIGDHATYHKKYDAPLNSDIEGLSGPISHWYQTVPTASDLPRSCRGGRASGAHRARANFDPYYSG